MHTLASYRIFQKAAPFDRRATSLAWHPTHPRILAVGSKGGDILLWNFGIKDKPTFIKGVSSSLCQMIVPKKMFVERMKCHLVMR